MTMVRLALRSHLGGFVATTAFAVLLGLLNAIAYADLAGSDAQQRAVFARQMELLGRQFSYLLPLPLELETMSGYLHWRMFGIVPLVYGFWAILAATGGGRGDEERGLVEEWLAAGVSRARYVGARILGFSLAAMVSVAVMMAATWAGSVVGNEPLAIGALAQQAVAVIAITLCCYAVALAVAQLATTRRGAAGAAGVLLLALFLVNSAGRTGGLEAFRGLSPFWAYDRSAPLLRGRSLDVGATAVVLAAAIVICALAARAFAGRDLGASLLRLGVGTARPTARPSRDPLLRLPVLAIVDQQRVWILGWTAGMAVLAAFLISTTRTTVDAMLGIPSLRVYIERLGSTSYDSFVAVIWGSSALLLLSLFAIFQSAAWVADDAEGRLEAVLAQPVSRGRVLAERLASLALASAVVVAGASLAVWLAAAAAGITLSPDRFVIGSALMLSVPLAFGAIGLVLASSRPRLAIPVLTTVAAASYVTQQFTPLFDWPRWVENTSIYALYGAPIARGVEWGTVGLAVLAVVGAALAGVLFARRDIAR
jgi:ABC-2 type transport system permease protein